MSAAGPTASPSPAEDDVQRMTAALTDVAPRLHGIESRTQTGQIAREVLRLNDAVREATTPGRLHYGAQPADFMAALLVFADTSNQAGE
ncbi:hypothetical protein SRS16P3_00138 (plasmid) [Variovorax sp. SRS16]|uniref:hypothetical protein n=1 Tax=Variovorax sp. SRS16 TaxID=282217 RepID=UPI001316F01A|nr:hypothetical protein [Variovorax sp. SRS16]VTU46426.1 hypothetical protein SRS16P3_00138 [Variovorax sp. SRS16]